MASRIPLLSSPELSWQTIVGNYVEKNRSRFPVAVLSTTIFAVTERLHNFSFHCVITNFNVWWCDILLERYFQAANYLECQLVNLENQICSCLTIAEQGGQKNRNGKMRAVLFRIVFYQ